MKTTMKKTFGLLVAVAVCTVSSATAFTSLAAPSSDSVVFSGKDCVGNSSWVQKDNPVANLDPGCYVEATMPGSFKEGEYTLTLNSCGNSRAMVVTATVNRSVLSPSGGTGFGMDSMKTDTMTGLLALKAKDVLRVTAPSGGYGWLNTVTLTPTSGTAVTFNAKDYVGNPSWVQSDNPVANLDPGSYIEITLPDSFVAGNYSLSLNACGNERAMEITVTSTRTVTAPANGTGFGMDQFKETTMADHLILAAGDTVRITAPSDVQAYGWLNTFYFTPVTASKGSSSSNASKAKSSSSSAAVERVSSTTTGSSSQPVNTGDGANYASVLLLGLTAAGILAFLAGKKGN